MGWHFKTKQTKNKERLDFQFTRTYDRSLCKVLLEMWRRLQDALNQATEGGLGGGPLPPLVQAGTEPQGPCLCHFLFRWTEEKNKKNIMWLAERQGNEIERYTKERTTIRKRC